MREPAAFVSVDLMPEPWHRRYRWRRHMAGLTAFGLLLSAGILAGGLHYSSRAASVTRELTRLSEVARRAKRLRADNHTLERQISLIEEGMARLDDYSHAAAWSRLLRRLGRSVPEAVFLTSLSAGPPSADGARRASSGKSKPTTGGAEGDVEPAGVVSIEGLAGDQKSLNDLLEVLKTDRAFVSVTLLGTKRKKIRNLEGLGFTVSCAW